MKYYININSWNLLESFVTESLSPYAFYNKRNFGNNLSRYLSGTNEKINFLLLSSTDKGGDYTIEIDESILDSAFIRPVKRLKTTFTYGKTIYYKVGCVKFRFANKALLDAFIAESQILFEVKCVEKYVPDFFIKKIKERKVSATLQKLAETFSFDQQEFINHDNRFNLVKGGIVGYVRGVLTSSGSEDQTLITMLKELKNSFAGLNTQIMVNETDVQQPEKYITKLRECKKLFFNIRNEKTNNFDILTQLFLEIRNLASQRYAELSVYKSCEWNSIYEKLTSRKQDVEHEICQIELDNHINEVKAELQEIKDKEKQMGEALGQSRMYFKKDTAEYKRKLQIKDYLKVFEDSNVHYKALLQELDNINQRILDSASGRSQYDNAISALFSRVSDIINDLQKKYEAGKTLNKVDLSPIILTPENILRIEDSNADVAEIEFFNVLLKDIVERDSLLPISDALILSLIEKAANEYKNYAISKTERGLKIISCLREYWRYKNNNVGSFSIPNDMPVIQSVMSFFLKPFGYDQIERFMLNKKFTEKKYALMLWAACNGYAALPKTFTSILYQDKEYFGDMDDLLQVTYNSL